jgi:DNA modification methylase
MAGLTEVPTVAVSHLSEAQIRAFVIADNRLAQDAEWDHDVLRQELLTLEQEGLAFEATGFELPEIDLILGDDDARATEPSDDDVPAPTPDTVVTRLGDVWQLGPHRLICGDARRDETYAKLMRGEKARMAFIDPPFNVPIHGHVGGKGRIQHREFVQGSGELTPPQFERLLEEALARAAERSVDGAIHFVCIDWRHLLELLTVGHRVFRELKNLIVWTKTSPGMGSFYRSRHELICVWKHGRAKHINNFGLGENGRTRSNVWSYPGANSFGKDRIEELMMHPTVKPVAMIADAILDCSNRGDIVVDNFAGSGTLAIACERTGRVARMIELDPIYCDVAIRRFQKMSGQQALLEGADLSFEACSQLRGKESSHG